ncbi:hypothetical protein D5S17_35395 [Pseudonocardiaceae bacterium YIM PH 21723]|nr:hypothetical protein D5S17_35395 [Pseudonocardiaceae bacterium YIM PH 21723]
MTVVALYNVAAIPVWAGLPVWSVWLLGALSTFALVWVCRRRYHKAVYGAAHHNTAVGFCLVAGLLGTAWMAFAAEVSPINITALGLLLLFGITLGVLFLLVRHQAPIKRETQRQIVALDQQMKEVETTATEQAQTVEEHRDQMVRADLAGVTVIENIDTAEGFRMTLKDNPNKPIKLSGLQSKIGNLASVLAADLHAQGIELPEHHVQAYPAGPAHLFYVKVRTKDIFLEPLPYQVSTEIPPLREPVKAGKFADQEPVPIPIIGRNGIMCSETGGGKTVFINNLIAGVAERDAVVAWVGGTEKLTPLVLPWLAPWLLGNTDRPLLDYVAGPDAYAVLDMLVAFYKLVSDRTSSLGARSKFRATPEDPAVVMFLEEAPDLLDRHKDKKVMTHKGTKMNASQLLDAIASIDRAAECGFWLLTQQGLIEALGPNGTRIRRNCIVRVAGATQSDYDGSSTLVKCNNVRTTQLKNNELLIQRDINVPVAESWKAFFLDELDLIGPVAEYYTPRKPAFSQQRKNSLGSAYARRWDADRLPELVQAARIDLGVEWPVGSRDGGQESPAPEQPVQPDSGAQTHFQDPAPEEITMMASDAEAKMTEAIAEIAKYGPLGKTMSELLHVVTAADCPEFAAAWMYAVVIGKAAPQASMAEKEAAGQALITELAGAPWQLPTEVRSGAEGWASATLRDRIHRYLDPSVASSSGIPQQRAGEVREPLRTLLARLQDFPGDHFVTTSQAVELLEDSYSANQLMELLRDEFGLPTQRPRGDNDARPRGWFLSNLRDAAEAPV